MDAAPNKFGSMDQAGGSSSDPQDCLDTSEEAGVRGFRRVPGTQGDDLHLPGGCHQPRAVGGSKKPFHFYDLMCRLISTMLLYMTYEENFLLNVLWLYD